MKSPSSMLRRHCWQTWQQQFLRRFSHCSTNIWQELANCKQLIGPRCMVLSSSNIDRELFDRMCFELQCRGVQPVQLRVPSSLLMIPNSESIKAAVELFRRTGCRSIISIGSGSETDLAKATRGALEESSPKTPPLRNTTSAQAAAVPLIAMATSWSPIHSRSCYAQLHDEEHTVVMHHGRPPDIVGTDMQLFAQKSVEERTIIRCYWLSHLFDYLFSISLTLLVTSTNASSIDSKAILRHAPASLKLDDLKNRIFGSDDASDETGRLLFEGACAMGQQGSHHKAVPEALPHALSLLSPPSMSNFLVQQSSLMMPYSFIKVIAFHQAWRSFASATADCRGTGGSVCQYDETNNKTIEAAFTLATDALLSIMEETDVNNLSTDAVTALRKLIRAKSKDFQMKKSKLASSEKQRNISARSCLELYSSTVMETMESTRGIDDDQNVKLQGIVRSLMESDMMADINDDTAEELSVL